MSYLGRKGAVAPLTSGDIPVGIVEGTDIAFLENASGTQNLSGTYSTERMYLNDSYTLTGDVTITGHLALGTIADSDVVITQDSTERTITGSGTLDAGNVLQDTHRTSVTGMTGTLGSAITGSPNLNLGNATFPAGHIINTWSFRNTITVNKTMTLTAGSWSIVDYGTSDGATGQIKITGITATENNLLYMSAQPGDVYGISDSSYAITLGFDIDGDKYPTQSTYYNLETSYKGSGNINATFLVPASFSNKTISVNVVQEAGHTFTGRLQTYRNIPSSSDGYLVSFTIFEIQQ